MLLKQSTAVDVLIGPFVDLTDGYTAETGESPTVKLSKNGQTLAAKNDATTPVSDADGYYNCELDATDTNTLGTLVLTVAASANALPIRHEFEVVTANTWDTLFSTDQWDVNVTNVAGTSQTAGDLKASINTAQADLDIITDTDGVILGAAGVDLIWDEVLTGATHNVTNSAGKRLRIIDAAFEVHSGTSQGGGTSSTFVMDTGADGTNDNIYRGDRIVVTGGTGVGEHGIIISYTASSRTATMSEAWVVTPDNTSEFTVVPADADVETWQHVAVTTSATTALPEVDAKSISDNAAAADNVQANIGNLDGAISTAQADLDTITGAAGVIIDDSAANDTTISDAVWDEAVAGHVGAGTFGATDAAILADTNELQTDWTNAGRLDAILDSVLAMLDDARGEPGQGAPPVNPDAMTKLDYLYKAWRNKTTQTATEYKLFADDTTTVDHKSTVSDDGTTATKGEIATGP